MDYGYLTVSGTQLDGREAGLDLIIEEELERCEKVCPKDQLLKHSSVDHFFLLCLLCRQHTGELQSSVTAPRTPPMYEGRPREGPAVAPRRYRWTVGRFCLPLVSGIARAGFPPFPREVPPGPHF